MTATAAPSPTSVRPSSCAATSRRPWRSTTRTRSIRPAASSSTSRTTARSTIAAIATWSAARASSSTTRWRGWSSASRSTSMPRSTACATCARCTATPPTAAITGRSATASRKTAPTRPTASPSCCWPTPRALKAGIDEAKGWMDETWDLLEQRYWEADAGLYRDEADADWNFSPYRGQNANMHMCEAMLAAYQATRETRYLDRALTLADHMTRRQAAKADGLVWEHYDTQLEHRLGVQQGRSEEPVQAVGLPARPPDRVGQAAADHGAAAARARHRAGLAGAEGEGSVRPRADARLGRGQRRHLLRLRAGRQRLRRRQVFLGAGRVAGRRRAARGPHRRCRLPRRGTRRSGATAGST